MPAFLVVAATTAVVCAVLTPLLRRIVLTLTPPAPVRDRDVHVQPIPRFGGVAMTASVLAGLGVASRLPGAAETLSGLPDVAGLFPALAVVLVLGVADDAWDLPWWAKLIGQTAAGLAVVAGGLRLEAMPVGWLPVRDSLVQSVLTVGLVVLTMNAVNFVDGLDGLAAGVALIGGSAFLVYTAHLTQSVPGAVHSDLAALLMALLVGACAGFLPYNVHPARIFMGEVGTLLIGLLMAVAAVSVTSDVGAVHAHRFRNVPAFLPVLLPLAVLALPLADLAYAVLRRTARGVSPFAADRGHLHHRLVNGGHTHARAVLLLWLWAFLIAWGVVALTFLPAGLVVPLVAVGLVLAARATLRPILRPEPSEPSEAPPAAGPAPSEPRPEEQP